MSKLFKVLSLVIILSFAFFFVQEAAAQNKLVNVDFENGDIVGWNRWAVTDDVSSEENHTSGGLYSVNPSLNEANGPFGKGALIQEFEDVSGGDKIEASVWIKTVDLKGPTDSNVYAILGIEFWEGEEMIGSKEEGRLTGTNDWQEVSLSCIVPEGTTMAKYVLILWNDDGEGNTGQAYFDDACMSISSY